MPVSLVLCHEACSIIHQTPSTALTKTEKQDNLFSADLGMNVMFRCCKINKFNLNVKDDDVEPQKEPLFFE